MPKLNASQVNLPSNWTIKELQRAYEVGTDSAPGSGKKLSAKELNQFIQQQQLAYEGFAKRTPGLGAQRLSSVIRSTKMGSKRNRPVNVANSSRTPRSPSKTPPRMDLAAMRSEVQSLSCQSIDERGTDELNSLPRTAKLRSKTMLAPQPRLNLRHKSKPSSAVVPPELLRKISDAKKPVIRTSRAGQKRKVQTLRPGMEGLAQSRAKFNFTQAKRLLEMAERSLQRAEAAPQAKLLMADYQRLRKAKDAIWKGASILKSQGIAIPQDTKKLWARQQALVGQVKRIWKKAAPSNQRNTQAIKIRRAQTHPQVSRHRLDKLPGFDRYKKRTLELLKSVESQKSSFKSAMELSQKANSQRDRRLARVALTKMSSGVKKVRAQLVALENSYRVASFSKGKSLSPKASFEVSRLGSQMNILRATCDEWLSEGEEARKKSNQISQKVRTRALLDDLDSYVQKGTEEYELIAAELDAFALKLEHGENPAYENLVKRFEALRGKLPSYRELLLRLHDLKFN